MTYYMGGGRRFIRPDRPFRAAKQIFHVVRDFRWEWSALITPWNFPMRIPWETHARADLRQYGWDQAGGRHAALGHYKPSADLTEAGLPVGSRQCEYTALDPTMDDPWLTPHRCGSGWLTAERNGPSVTQAYAHPRPSRCHLEMGGRNHSSSWTMRTWIRLSKARLAAVRDDRTNDARLPARGCSQESVYREFLDGLRRE